MKATFVSALLVAGALALPHIQLNKRATFTEEVTMTEWTTTTVWVGPTGAGFAERHSGSASSSSVTSTSVSTSSATSLSIPIAVDAVKTSNVATPAAATLAPTVAPPAATPTPAAPVPAPASGGGPSGTGQLTFYELGQVSCGQVYTDADFVVALAVDVMNNPANPNNNPLCGKTITITYQGHTQQAKVVDTCQGCASGDVDLSPTLFQALVPAGLGAGRVSGASWSVY